MSRPEEHAENDEWIDVTAEERAELEAASAEADAHPDDVMDFRELMRRLRNGT